VALLALQGSSGLLEVWTASAVERLVQGTGAGVLQVDADEEELVWQLYQLAGLDVLAGENGELRLVALDDDARYRRVLERLNGGVTTAHEEAARVKRMMTNGG